MNKRKGIKMSLDSKYCPTCMRSDGEGGKIKKRHRNTSFVNDSLNYLISCKECWQEDWDYYQERWEDYNAELYAGLYGG